MSTIKIVSGVIDTKRLSMMTEEGEEIIIKQGDTRLRPLIDFITEPMMTDGFALVPKELLEGDQPKDELPYAEYEEKSGGVVKFFRVAKKMLKKFLGNGDAESKKQAMSNLDNGEVFAPRTFGHGGNAKAAVTKAAVEEIMAAGVPASDPEFRSENVKRQENVVNSNGVTPTDRTDQEGTLNDTSSTDTIVAVVTDPETKVATVVPGVEKIESQVKRANQNGNSKGVTALLARLGKVIEERGHTADDVLRFLQRADMSVADNGDIIALKVLQDAGGKVFKGLHAPEEQYTDCHSGNVHQWVGSVVQMPINMVDKSRSNECSVGLHIARRGYLRGGFGGGQVCVIAIIKPEDFIAVPLYDANKVRVCKYHIVHKLTDKQRQEVYANRPFTTVDGGDVLLANLIKGKYAPATHIVNIGGGYGSNLTVTRVDGKTQAELDAEDKAAEEAKVEHDQTISEPALPDIIVEPKKVDAPVTMDAVQTKLKNVGKTRAEIAKALYDNWVRWSTDPLGNDELVAKALGELLEFKKKAKVGWDKLGVPNNGKVPTFTAPVAKQLKAAHQKLATAVNEAAATKGAAKPQTAKKQAAAKPVAPSKQKKETKPMTPRQELALVLKDKTPETITKAIAEQALSIKQFAKKGWGVLGVSSEIERAIMKHINKSKW